MLLVTRRRRSVDIWPGFVDALAAMLMVVMFVLLLFSVGQYLLTDALVGRDQVVDRLRSQISGLADVLAMERKEKSDLQERLSTLRGELEVTLRTRDETQNRLAEMTLSAQESAAALQRTEEDLQFAQTSLAEKEQSLRQQRDTIAARDEILRKQRQTIAVNEQRLLEQSDAIADLEADRGRLQTALSASEEEAQQQKTRAGEVEATVSELNGQIAALNEQLARINQALEVSEAKLQDKEVQIEDLGRRLNLAMANKVEELSRYRSDFFGKLREALSDNPDVRVEGDRFVLPSEVLFSSASADLDKEGAREIATVARTLKQIMQQIPDDIDWVLRVDGHTDRRPIRRVFASNWELSSARAISIVKYMISKGVPAEHLVAAGFGQYHPIDAGESEEAYRRNRRIELKLTSR
jgi:chemotaxis protein MotB